MKGTKFKKKFKKLKKPDRGHSTIHQFKKKSRTLILPFTRTKTNTDTGQYRVFNLTYGIRNRGQRNKKTLTD